MIRRQVVVAAPPERVWEFLTDPDAAGPWLGGHLAWSPAEGGRISFQGEDGSLREGVVEEVRPNRFIRYTWWPADSDDCPPSEVSFLLEPAAGDTRLTVMERILEGPDRPSPPRAGREITGPATPAGPTPPQASAAPHPPMALHVSPGRRSTLSAGTSGRWGAGDELMLSTWARAASLCQIG